MEFPMQLLGDLLAVHPGDPFSKANVTLPDWQKVLRGRVIAVGPDVKGVTVNDVICFGAAKGMESTFDSKPLRIMREDDVDGVLE